MKYYLLGIGDILIPPEDVAKILEVLHKAICVSYRGYEEVVSGKGSVATYAEKERDIEIRLIDGNQVFRE
jgi:hypothetical protein